MYIEKRDNNIISIEFIIIKEKINKIFDLIK